MDEAIGRVRQKLADSGLERDTLVVFISDNGGPTMPGVTVNGARNEPLRGSKRTTLEGGIRVPFVVSWSGQVIPGVFDQPAIQLDLHATALAAAGVTANPKWKLGGVDLIPFLRREQTYPPHAALFWRLGKQMAVRSGDYKLVRYDLNADTRTGRKQDVSPAKLYNLRDEIGETKDLGATMPDKVSELQSQWDSWNGANINPLWGSGAGDDEGAEPGGKGEKKKNQAIAVARFGRGTTAILRTAHENYRRPEMSKGECFARCRSPFWGCIQRCGIHSRARAPRILFRGSCCWCAPKLSARPSGSQAGAALFTLKPQGSAVANIAQLQMELLRSGENEPVPGIVSEQI